MSSQTVFPIEFRTARPPLALFCHQEFLDELQKRKSEPSGKRASLLMQRMAVDASRLHYKSTSGVNAGWRRSRLGGGSGSHFYAWWAPAGAAPFKRSPGFSAYPEAMFLRAIRHHDDHAPLSAGDPAGDYLPMNVSDLRGGDYAPEPWTPPQVRFARSHAFARVLKGHPGSGKTTALLNAADESQAERVLYLTFSSELAALARDYFDRFCSDARTFVVQTFPGWLRRAAGKQDGEPDLAEARARFRRDLANYQRSIAPWSNELDALYDEMHAHLVGAALPEKLGRFAAAERLRLPDEAYRAHRSRYLGPATGAVLEAVRCLERMDRAPLADRYFPDLALAWRAATALAAGGSQTDPLSPGYGCIAVDEVQDLTPLEAYAVIAFARKANAGFRPAALLLAGDEAQTVRATDFEWAWLNDMLHHSLGAPQEFKLPVNLRSPRRIASLVNRAWDLYDYLHKQDRPSGTGYAEIDDDSPDEVVYSAIRAEELAPLLSDFSTREGMAVIAFDQAGIPREALPSVLSPAEAKGLDFNSVCILNGGALLRRISDPRSDGAANALTRRLAIDELRVALSRPAGQLIWIDAAPSPEIIRQTGEFLAPRGETTLAPVSLEALRAGLAENDLDVEERIQRCQHDARQYAGVKPDLAWSRAQQAVSMLGAPGDPIAVEDPAARSGAYLTLVEVGFKLAFRGTKLSAELGKPDLYPEAAHAARLAGKLKLGNAIQAIGACERFYGPERLNRIASLVQMVSEAREELPSWLIVEITPRADAWIGELEMNLDPGDNAVTATQILPPFFDALGLPNAQGRKLALFHRAVRSLVKNKKHVPALEILERMPATEPYRKQAAECYEESGQFEKAAARYLELGDNEKALRCFRAAADFEGALRLVRQLESHPAKESLEWLAELNTLLERRPAGFNRVMTPPEKKMLEAMLERGLGVQRKKPAAKKPAAKKAAPKKPKAPKAAAKPAKTALKRPVKRRSDDFF